ncbi:MAG TPA: Gfo/Idh/MocA family oxidoreductase [Kofleriaceae bacterium]|jgi:predicted dehydrogenase|nr:Gfo/Idh/MocA family oxidoreductase [Kofleriaceae bacterium]
MSMRIGILGAAKIAGSFMVGAKASGRVDVVAVASRDRARGEAFAAAHGIARACSYDELLADRAIDAIYNPLPNSLHAEWTIAAARAGKHVLCEKPLALGEPEAQAMFAAADASGVAVIEAFPYWFQPQTLELERLIAAGAIGEVKTMFAAFGFTITPATHAGNIRLAPALGGGALLDAGCYPVSFVRQVFGARPVRVTATACWVDGLDQSLAATLVFPGGGLAQVSCSFATALHRRAIIAGTAGVIETDYHNHTDREAAPGYLIRRGSDAQAKVETVPVARENGFRVEIDAFADLIERGDHAAIAARRAASLDNVWTLAALLASARAGAGE